MVNPKQKFKCMKCEDRCELKKHKFPTYCVNDGHNNIGHWLWWHPRQKKWIK